ncbi:Rieske 2Fe-2S domain-containing protein [Nostocaceae cyanobacterium CENA369]|uniref:Rieske 2Fe-2S domain-containing protein n=1 Tax=Dendronalium phyllosphericum CENA369 TaxID=1725256 RepID=A0A8J7I8S5_9NOST|nr:Rieske 2Fe-2S domain-containing protein [Dendronalium phyllosphericum]MBH8575256.1 Rieske 2Fe-2S domain-containing protein [Dendronalium phyllosphericum CENA369]
MEPILPGAPWLIAHRSMLGVNKPHKITLNAQDYVIWQNQQGEIFAINNICPHMQAPLSDGWVCQERDTITCPFHALEFDGQGRLYQKDKQDTQPITKPLKLVISNDCIWTYAGFEPKLPIPDLHQRIVDEYEFMGVSGEKSIQGDLLSNIMVNYDYNHQNGTHKELFKITSCHVTSFEENGYYATVKQDLARANNKLGEIIKNPILGILPKNLSNTLEYSFPSTTVFFTKTPIGKIAQTHILYPETEKRTKTFILMYAQVGNPLMKFLFKNSVLQAAATVIEQDTGAVESLYPRQKPKIRLPNEEIMFYAEKLYRNW